MFSTRIYLKIVFQVALILLVTGVGLTGIITGKAIILGVWQESVYSGV